MLNLLNLQASLLKNAHLPLVFNFAAHVIAKAKGLAILSVIKAGFLVTARGGSGVVLARLPDGSKLIISTLNTIHRSMVGILVFLCSVLGNESQTTRFSSQALPTFSQADFPTVQPDQVEAHSKALHFYGLKVCELVPMVVNRVAICKGGRSVSL